MYEPTGITDPELIHRLKNHLCIIVGFCDLMLADSPDDDPRRPDLLEVQKAARHAMELMPEVTRRVRDED